jgi:hypothetical protein
MRVRTMTAGVIAAALALAGCGAGDDEVVTDDRPSPEQALARAADQMFDGSGRFEMRIEDDDAPDLTIIGEHAGGDLRIETRPDSGSFGATTELYVDEVWYTSFNSAMSGLIGVPEGIEWASLDASEVADELGGPTGPFPGAGIVPSAGGAGLDGLPSALADATEVSDDGTESIDGVEYRRLRASLTAAAIFGQVDDPLELDAEVAESADLLPADLVDRFERVLQAQLDHTRVDAVVLLADDGGVRRATFAVATDLPDEYQSCLLVLEAEAEYKIVVDVIDPPGPITITAPDPSTVITPAELYGDDDGAMPEWMDEMASMFDESLGDGSDAPADGDPVAGLDDMFGDTFDSMFESMLEGCPA